MDGRDCTLCNDVGWILDGNPAKLPRTLELISCPIPDCAACGQHVAHLSLNELGFTRPVVRDGVVLAVGR
jgi:hypothetical protein